VDRGATRAKGPDLKRLTTVSYALLGFLAIRPFSAYELEKMIRTSGAQLVWPRTRSRIYDEPKNLVAHGLTTAQGETRNGRSRVVYSITPAGRAGLEEWLAQPGAAPSVEDEAMLKVFYSSFGDLPALHVQLEKIRTDLTQRYRGLIGALEPMTAGKQLFREREHMTNLLIRHFMSSLDARLDWLEEVEAWIETWPDTQIDGPRREETRAKSAELLEQATARLRRLEGSS
jgi:PadR family transcriptional regulator AphA